MKRTPAHWKVGSDRRKRKPRSIDGLPVMDADKYMVLTIRSDDIRGSKKADAAHCAAARALKRTCGSEARVYLTRTYVKIGKAWQRFMTPESISREITAFDRGARFEPSEYVLTPPAPTNRLGYRRAPSGPSGSKTRKTASPRHVTASVRKMK